MIPDSSFPPGRNDPCYCGSGERFKHCCGAMIPQRRVPMGIVIIDDFLSPQECQELVDVAATQTAGRFTMTDNEGNAIPDEHRMTEWVDFRETNQDLLDNLVARAFEEKIIPTTGLNIDWYEEPQLLRYSPGDYYLHHSDAHYFVPEAKAWRKAVDRDISIIIYLNDNFEGGELDFKRLAYKIKPRTGMLVWFPSDVRFEHMAMPVTHGTRYALVSWASVTGVEKVQKERAKRAIDWATREKKQDAN